MNIWIVNKHNNYRWGYRYHICGEKTQYTNKHFCWFWEILQLNNHSSLYLNHCGSNMQFISVLSSIKEHKAGVKSMNWKYYLKRAPKYNSVLWQHLDFTSTMLKFEGSTSWICLFIQMMVLSTLQVVSLYWLMQFWINAVHRFATNECKCFDHSTMTRCILTFKEERVEWKTLMQFETCWVLA